MITGFRIVKRKWSANAFDGEGARLYGGRWNSQSQACVYLAGSESLAILEILVHLDNAKQLQDYRLFSVEIPEKQIMLMDANALPANWQEDPAPAETAELGDEWLNSQASLALCVPSSIVVRERNFVLNIQHPQFPSMMHSMVELPFSMDNRLL